LLDLFNESVALPSADELGGGSTKRHLLPDVRRAAYAFPTLDGRDTGVVLEMEGALLWLAFMVAFVGTITGEGIVYHLISLP